MRDLAAGTHWALAGAREEYAAGNGPAMRIAPLALLLNPIGPQDRTLIRDVCRITHHSDETYVGALAGTVVGLAGSDELKSIAGDFAKFVVDGLHWLRPFTQMRFIQERVT